MPSAVRLDGITKKQAGRLLFRDVSLDVAAGDSVALVGASGIGKTTLLRIVAGLERPDAGDVWIAGRRATQGRSILVPPHQRGIGFVFQDLALWPHMTVEQSLTFVLRSAAPAVSRIEHQRMVDETLRLVHIDGLGDRYPHQLSGGEQQRAAFARALVHRPPLLLLDEPFSSLDLDLRQNMRETLGDLRRAIGFATVFVTHDRDEASAVAARRIALTRGGGFEDSIADSEE
jgi:ABC-type Fe3+/spermidine/putrescine transport system ATPase subunit